MAYRPTRRWLSDLACLHDAFAALPLVQVAVTKSLTEASDPAFLGKERRTWAELVEDRLAYHFIESERSHLLRDEAVAAAQQLQLDDLPPVVGFSVERFGGQRAPADLLFIWKHATGKQTVVPANVKVETARYQCGSFGVALAPLVNFITGGELEVRHRSDPDHKILCLLAGTQKLSAGRDYYLLRINTYSGSIPQVTLQGMLSRHSADGRDLTISRHASRDTVLYRPCGPIIAPTFDVARAFGEAMLPRAREGRLGAALMAYCPPQERRAFAETLVATGDAGISQLLADFFAQIAASRPTGKDQP